MRNSNQIIILK